MVTIASGVSSTSNVRLSVGRRRDGPTISSLMLVLAALLLFSFAVFVHIFRNDDADRLVLVRTGIPVPARNIGTVDLKQSMNGLEDADADPSKNIVTLSLRLDNFHGDGEPSKSPNKTARVRLALFAAQTPKAAKYIRQLAQEQDCTKCTLYRGEPVPSYWGSEDYPDRYFDNGRWGPPYALVQGAFLLDDGARSSTTMFVPPVEAHRPVVQRGMVAWAGGQGGPHFFVALADHPEWGHGHTVFATVLEEDMPVLDALVVERLLVSTTPSRPPIVTNFVDPIPIQLLLKTENGT
jgi:cyclophilin family peptidyl-prolyl cis-trans isomerase